MLERFSLALVLLVVGLAAFAVYLASLAPSIAWAHEGADSGDLVAAAAVLGVPHPTGYPLYTLLGHLATYLTPNEPALAVNRLSASTAALAAMLTGYLAATLVPRRQQPLAALSAGGLLAVSPVFWSQAILAEVYALAVLLLLAILAGCVRWRQEWPAPAARRWLYMGAAAFGLSLAHHVTVILITPILIGFVLVTARQTALAPRFWLGPLLTGASGLLWYAYLPLAAAGRPPVYWGQPNTWDGFWWTVLGGAYGRNAFRWDLLTPAAGADIVGRSADQIGWIGLALAALGVVWLARRDWPPAALLAGAAAVLTIYRLTYNTFSISAYYIPLYAVLAVFAGVGLAIVAGWAARRFSRARVLLTGLGALLIVLLGARSLQLYPTVTLREATEPRDYGVRTLTALPPHAVLVTNRDEESFSLWYAQYALGIRPDIALVSPPLLEFDWYQRHLERVYPDLVVGGLDGPIGSRFFDVMRRNLPARPVFLGEPMPVVPLYFDVELGAAETMRVVRDKADVSR